MRRFFCWTALFSLDVFLMAAAGPIGRWGFGFAALYLIAFGALAGMVRAFPGSVNRRCALVAICIYGLFLRGAFAWFPPGNDVNRYVWEGVVQTQGFNPYALAPNDPALSVLASGPFAGVWEGINHKDLSAGYPPLALSMFRLLAELWPDPWFFKLVMAAADAASLIPLALIFFWRRVPPARMLWYAANPLLLVFIAGEGHLDSLMVLMLVTGCALVLSGRERWGFFIIGCAAMVKYFAWLAIPFLLRKNRFKAAWLSLPPAALYLVYADAGSGLFDSLITFGTRMHYNDSLAALLRPAFGPLAPGVLLLCLTAGLAISFLIVHDRLRSLFLAFGCLLVCLPTLHPWYLAWIAPFAALFASSPWLTLQAAAVFTFPVLMVEFATGVFQEIYWLKVLEYLPFYLLLLYGLRRRGVRPVGDWKVPQTLSVVIPTLNEEAHISGCLQRLGTFPEISQVIVCDGGSVDTTRERAAHAGAALVSGAKGRGCQIREGLRYATGDVVLVLHADAKLDPGAPGRILDLLREDPLVVGGAIGMRFDGGGRPLGLIAGLNNLRTRVSGIAFGDQGQFFRADALAAAGGFPDLMLMEDVALSLRLKEVGQLAFLPKGVTASGRRWQKKPFSANVFVVLTLFSTYLLGRRLGSTVQPEAGYYDRYYGN